MVGTVVKNTGYIVRAWVFLYKEVVQLVFFYESKSWGVTGAMLKLIEGFHHWVARIITAMVEQHTMSTESEWPRLDGDLDIAGLCLIKECIQRRQATVVD